MPTTTTTSTSINYIMASSRAAEDLYSAMLGRMLSMSRTFRALPRLPCAPPPRLDGYEALMRCHSALEPGRAARARSVAMVFVEDLRGLTPMRRSEALTGHREHAPLFTDAWVVAAGSAWADYATLLVVLTESPTREAALLHMAETEPGAFWTQVWRWLLMQHASYVGTAQIHDDDRVALFQDWLCAIVIARAHPAACVVAWALFDEEQRRCESLGLWIDMLTITLLLERHAIVRPPSGHNTNSSSSSNAAASSSCHGQEAAKKKRSLCAPMYD
jgi:hypothetical protein